MIKYLKILLICLIFPFFTLSCNSNFIKTLKSPLKIAKPSSSFYTNNLIKTINSSVNNSYNLTISIFYSKLGKNKTIPKEYMENINLFFNSLKTEYFLDYSTSNIDTKNPEYRLTVYLNEKSIFVIDILNDKYITIYPWDGSYEPDLIDISNLHTRINLFNIVDYIIKYHN